MKLRPHWKTGFLLLALATTAGAQVYKWKDAKGVTHFSDTPPPPSVGKVELKSFRTGAAPALPFELAEAVKNHPVTLYTTAQCEACDQGRAMLRARGIPFTEKTVFTNADQNALKQAGSAGQLPLLLVGRARQIGFEQGAWDKALNAAAYPSQAMLPNDYQAAAPAPAAPAARSAARPDAAAAAAAAEQAWREQLPRPSAAPDFQF